LVCFYIVLSSKRNFDVTLNGFCQKKTEPPKLKSDDKPKSCGQCDYFLGHYCKLLANCDVARTTDTKACDRALPKQNKRKFYW